jgi:Arc/MetJ family transcription regulator
MRTNIDIDDELMRQAMAATNTTTKKAAVEEALRLMVKIKGQSDIRKWRGKIVWRGHDDDWFASDEEILAKRRQAKALTETASTTSNLGAEELQLVGEQGRR